MRPKRWWHVVAEKTTLQDLLPLGRLRYVGDTCHRPCTRAKACNHLPMTRMRMTLISSAVAVTTLFLSGVLSYLWLWHISGLDSIGPADGSGAAMGAFAVVVESIAVGAISALVALVLCTLYLRSRQCP